MPSTLKRIVAGVIGLGIAMGTVAVAATADTPSIDDIMSQAHNKKKGLEPKIKIAVKDGKWDDAAAPADKLKELGEALTKTKADKGPADSWKKLADAYKTTTADIAAGVKKKDAKATEAALAKLARSCDGCHEKHRD